MNWGDGQLSDVHDARLRPRRRDAAGRLSPLQDCSLLINGLDFANTPC